jgi:hypothetical protein
MQLCLEKNNKTNMLSGSILSELIDMAITPDAYSENLYALLISTPQFNQDLLNIQVPLSKDNKNKISLRQYLDKEQSKAWWNYIIDFPANCIELLIREDSDNKPGTSYMPTLRDAELIEELQQHISLSQIESTGMMELEVELQNPYVTALLADSICTRLNRYINNYRKAKAITRYQFSDSIYNESKHIYLDTHSKYASYRDSNQKISNNYNKLAEERLKTENNIAYTTYMNSALQRQANLNNVILEKPIYHIVQPSYISAKASSPKKLVILSYCLFLSLFIPSTWITFYNTRHSSK